MKCYKSQAKEIQRKPPLNISQMGRSKKKEKSYKQPENKRHATLIRTKIILTADLSSAMEEDKRMTCSQVLKI